MPLSYMLNNLSIMEGQTFGPLLSKFKSSFSSSDLNTTYNDVNLRFIDDNNISIIEKWYCIRDRSLLMFKNFICSHSKESQYEGCRWLKDVSDISSLITKCIHDDQLCLIENQVRSLQYHIDDNGNLYYAIAASLEGSAFESLPKELIGCIFFYVNGDVIL